MSCEVMAGVQYREIGAAGVLTINLRLLLSSWSMPVNVENCALVRAAVVETLTVLCGAVEVEMSAPGGAGKEGAF